MNTSQLLDLIAWDMRRNRGLHLDALCAKLLLVEIRFEQFVFAKTHSGRGRALLPVCLPSDSRARYISGFCAAPHSRFRPTRSRIEAPTPAEHRCRWHRHHRRVRHHLPERHDCVGWVRRHGKRGAFA